MFCEKCGSHLEEDARFCTACGYPVQPLFGEPDNRPVQETTNDITQEPVSSPLPEPVVQAIPEQQWPGQMQYGQYPAYAPYAPRKKMNPKTKKLIIIIASAIAVAAAALAVFLIISGHPINRFKGFLQAQEYDKASELYMDEISGKSDLKDSAYKVLKDYADNIKTQFVNESLSYKEASGIIDDIHKMGILDEDELYDVYLSIGDLNDSRTAFAEAETLYNKQDYAGSITQYRKVIKDDANYEKSQQQIEAASQAYRGSVLEQADSLMVSKSYDEALDIMNEALAILPDDTAIMQKIADCNNAKTEYIRTQALSQAQASVGQNDYAAAFATLADALDQLPDDTQLQNSLKYYQDEFASKAIENAETAFGSSHNCDAALDILNSALGILPGDQTLLGAVVYYESLVVWLKDLSYSDTDGLVYDDSSTMDAQNNVYKHSYSVDGSYVDVFYAEYQINGEYKKFEGVCAIPSDMGGTATSKYFEVYGDGELLFTSKTMTGNASPVPFSIDISGVKVLRIQYPATDGLNKVATIFDGKLIK